MRFAEYMRVAIPVKMKAEESFSPVMALNLADFKLHWFTSFGDIEGVCNVHLDIGKTKPQHTFPVYECPLCKRGLIVPDCVEDSTELDRFLSIHMLKNHLEDRT